MSTDSQYIPALEAMQQINMPPDVFVALLRSHEAELPLSRNDEEMTIRKAFEYADFRCMRWTDIHRKFYTKELQNADTYLRYFKLYLPQWQKFVVTHKEEIHFDLPLAVEQAVPQGGEPPLPQVQLECSESIEDVVAGVEEGVEAHIAAWEAIIPKLAPKEQKIGKIVIEKWRGKSHRECYSAIIGHEIKEDSKVRRINRAKVTAAEIAKRHGLTMPSWQSQS